MKKKLDIERLHTISSEIEMMVDDMGIDIIDACVLYSEQNDIEVESLGEIIKGNIVLTNKIQREAEALNFIKPEARIHFDDNENDDEG